MPLTSSRQASAKSGGDVAPPASPVSGSSPAAPSAGDAAEVVEIPFKSLFARLHPSVQALPHTMPEAEAFFKLPLKVVHDQFSRGVIRIPMTQFRAFSPPGVFPPAPVSEGEQKVELPLGEIVPRLKPSQFPARKTLRKVEAPADIAPIFGPNGAPPGTVKVSEVRAKTSAEKLVEQPQAVTASPMAPDSAGRSALVEASIPLVPKAVELPPPTPAPAFASSQTAPAENQEPIRAPGLDPALATFKPQPKANVFSIPVMDMASYWAGKGRSELSGLYRHTLEIPLDKIEQGLKRGRLLFKWAELKTWIRLAPGTTLEALADEMEVELPLQVVAPRYLEAPSIVERHR